MCFVGSIVKKIFTGTFLFSLETLNGKSEELNRVYSVLHKTTF